LLENQNFDEIETFSIFSIVGLPVEVPEMADLMQKNGYAAVQLIHESRWYFRIFNQWPVL
jgi:hypothetical protein